MSGLENNSEVNKVQAAMRGYRKQPENNPYKVGTKENEEYHKYYLVDVNWKLESQYAK